MLKRLMLPACLCLASCASTSVEPLLPPPSLTSRCAAPVRLPVRDLTDQEVEVLWGRDRDALKACGSQLDGLSNWAILPTSKR
jgi:hypothetical protein